MANVNTLVGILLSLKDEASGGLKTAGGNLSELGNSAAQAGAKFLVVTESLKQVAGMVEEFMGRALDFDQSVQRSAIAMQMSGAEANKLKESIKDLADQTLGGIYSSQQAADAFRAIADEGRGLESTLAIVQDAMNLAAATGEDLAGTTSNLEDILSAWNMSAEESARVSDVLLNTWQQTGAPVGEVSGQLINMGQIMTNLGISFEEGSALIGVFKDVGVDGVTGLLSAFTQLTNSESKASKALADMGVSALDASGNLKTPTVLFDELRTAGLSATDALELFGIRGSASMVAAINNIGTVGDVAQSSLGATGAAAEAAGQYADSSAAKQEKFNAAMEDLQLTLAEGILPALTGFFEVISPILNVLGEYPEIIYAIVAGLVAYKIATVASTIANMANTTSIWASTVAMLSNPITIIAVAVAMLVLGLLLLAKHWDKVTEAAGNFAKGAGEKLAAFFKWAGEGIEGMRKGLSDAWDWMAKGWKDANKKTEDALKGAADWLGNWGKDRWNEAQDLAKKMIKEYLNMGKDMAQGIQNGLDGLKNFFGGLWDKMVEWGSHMMEAFKEGIEQAKKKVMDAIGNIADGIKNFLGFSRPPDMGPLHHVPDWGKHMLQTYSDSLGEGLPTVRRRMDEISRAVVITPVATPGSITSFATNDNRKVVQENHYHITHADPEYIAGRVLEILAEALGGL